MRLQGHVERVESGPPGILLVRIRLEATHAVPAQEPLHLNVPRDQGASWIPGEPVHVEIITETIRRQPRPA